MLLLFIKINKLLEMIPETEVAVRTHEELAMLVDEFLSAKFHNLFYNFSMNHKTTPYQFKSFIANVIESTEQLRVKSNVCFYSH